MAKVPESIEKFLSGRRIAVAGVSRHSGEAANAIFRKLRSARYEVFAINPKTTEVEGVRSYPNVATVPAQLDGIVIATPPSAALDVVRQSAAAGIERVWFHRSFGRGSVSGAAVNACHALRIECIVGGCPLMFCQPIDFGHRCVRWWLERHGRMTA